MANTQKPDQKNSILNLNRKVCIITGAASGIGAATAKLFATLGAQLSLADKNADGLNSVAVECEILSPSSLKPLLAVGDVADENYRTTIVENTVSTFDRLDVLVNNAGVLCAGNTFAETYTKFDQEMNVNVRAVYHLTTLATPHLIKTKGAIVNLSSLTAGKPIPQYGPYCLSKAAVDNFTKLCAIELGPHQVRVNCVRPGYIKTNILSTVMDQESFKKNEEDYTRLHALERNGEPKEVANVIAFLASDLASFITGADVAVDGGANILGRQ